MYKCDSDLQLPSAPGEGPAHGICLPTFTQLAIWHMALLHMLCWLGCNMRVEDMAVNPETEAQMSDKSSDGP